MAPRDPTPQSAAGLGLSIPPGLQEADYTLRIEKESFDFERLLEDLRSYPNFSHREDGGGIRGAFPGEAEWGAAHIHFSAERVGSGKQISIGIELVADKHGSFSKRIPNASEFLKSLAGYFKNADAARRGLIGAHFQLSMDDWTPTVPLPFTPPGQLNHLPGLPRIDGLDFSFGPTEASQPLMRAFVTTYEEIRRMTVRLLMVRIGPIGPQLVSEMMAAATLQIQGFAQRVDSK